MEHADARVSRAHWDSDAARYVSEHAYYLDDFHWCPERLTEDQAHLLGDVRGKRILELGAGTAPCSAWVAAHGGIAIAQDISRGMLSRSDRSAVFAVQSDAAALPFVSQSFDATFSSFGALPFLADLPGALREVRRVLKPGGRCVLASNHPMAWVFPDDPGPIGLLAQVPYFQSVYEEFAEDGERTYAEYHHTVGDWIRAHAAAGLLLEDVVEPEWRPGTPAWGQWSELRGSVFPGTAIFVSRATSH